MSSVISAVSVSERVSIVEKDLLMKVIWRMMSEALKESENHLHTALGWVVQVVGQLWVSPCGKCNNEINNEPRPYPESAALTQPSWPQSV